jgi:hypothetical protein
MKKTVCAVLAAVCVLVLCISIASSCGADGGADPGLMLGDILESYRKNGMASWWEILAVYNAGENPLDSIAYKGFEEILYSLEERETSLRMASYVIISNIAIAIGSDSGYYYYYEEYRQKLRELLEDPTDEYNLNDYIFGYLALKTSGMKFDENHVINYIISDQKDDGGFALSGDRGDIDMTAFVIAALGLYFRNENDISGVYLWIDMEPLISAMRFLTQNINANGTFSSWFSGDENANSTACALSALIGFYGDGGGGAEIIEQASGGLALFRVKNRNRNETGYSYLRGGRRPDALSTAQAAIALGDFINNISVWEKLYLDMTGQVINNYK